MVIRLSAATVSPVVLAHPSIELVGTGRREAMAVTQPPQNVWIAQRGDAKLGLVHPMPQQECLDVCDECVVDAHSRYISVNRVPCQ